jgi:hypothetical protein
MNSQVNEVLSERYTDTFTGVRLLHSLVISFNVALSEVLAIRFSTLSPLLEANFERPFRGLFSVSPRSCQRFRSLEIVDLLIFNIFATYDARQPPSISCTMVFVCPLVIVYRVLQFCKQGYCIETGMNIGLKFRIL